MLPEEFKCPCGVGQISDMSEVCPLVPDNTYQPVEGARTTINCPNNSISPAGSDSLYDCQCKETFKTEYDYNSTGQMTTFNCYCAPGTYLTQCSCLQCAAAKYQDGTDQSSCKDCPSLSSTETTGSNNFDDCECGEGLSKEYDYNSDGTRGNFACYCDKGKYLNKTTNPYKCLKCEICDPLTYPGYCKKGGEKESPVTCAPCEVCHSASQKRAGCGFLSDGECSDKNELVRTPWCPVADTSKTPLEISARQASGLCSFTFEVFGSDAPDADFVCSRPCDSVEYDSIQCDGPFECNVKTSQPPKQTRKEMCVVQRMWPLERFL